MVVGLDAKMKIVCGWYYAEKEESSDKSKWKKKKKWKKKRQTAGSNPGVPSYNTRAPLSISPLGHGGVLTKSMTFVTIVDVLHALIQNLCNLNQNAGL